MNNPDRAFEEVQHVLSHLAKRESTETEPLEMFMLALAGLSDWGCDVSVGAMRYVMHDINDNLIRELRRQSKQETEP